MRGRVAENLNGLKNAALYVRHRHGHANASGAANKNVLLRHMKLFRQHGGHFVGVFQALFAGAGVGVAGIHDNGLRDAFLDALDANFHRRGANLIGGEHAGDSRRHFRNNQREVAFLALV